MKTREPGVTNASGGPPPPKPGGSPPPQDRAVLIRQAVSAVSVPMLAGVSIIAIVFLPLLTLQRSEEHTSELQSRLHLVSRLLLEKKKGWSLPCSPLRPATGSPSRD